MEVYTNASATDRRVILDFPLTTGATIDAKIFNDEGEEVFEFTTISATGATVGEDYYMVTLPLFLCQFDSRLYVNYDVTYLEAANSQTYTVSKSHPVDVVTPILTKAEIKAVWDTATDEEVVTIEKAVRHIIQAYTGQTFGRYIGKLPVRGTGGQSLGLPRRLLSLEQFNGQAVNPAHFLVQSDGYTLRWYPFGVPPVKADYHGLHMHTGGVIHNPNNVRWQNFRDNYTYELYGHWGWESIPNQVKEAAKLLVNDYACADSQYRDRYLVSMTAADWRVQFNSGAYLRTGNVRADQLLSDFVVTRGWGII